MLAPALAPLLVLAGTAPCTPTVSGDLRVETFASALYGDRRTLHVWLPPGYQAPENAARRYPVLYLFDGQTAFDECTAFKGEHELRVDETVTQLVEQGKIPPLIVVGIDSGAHRNQEYAPYRDPLGNPDGPEPAGHTLPGFVVGEVMPIVAKGYRVTSDPTLTGIGGTSLGATAALEVLLARPDRFGAGLLQSPNLPMGNGQILRDTAFLARGPDRVYLGVGAAELPAVPEVEKFTAKWRLSRTVSNEGYVEMARVLAGHLKAAYLNRPEVTLVVEPDGHHQSASWARRLPAALVALYGRRGHD